MPMNLTPSHQAQLKQIAQSIDGIDAGDLMSKGLKKELHDMGLVWPAYGGNFRLTPAGKRKAEELGIAVGPMAHIPIGSLRELCEGCADSEWDRKQQSDWMELAE